ncbi:MAG: type II toxin-antitoxin system prevent-host-death family antitoxin [Gammaproteobacteria bacterium]|nr:type II toxin-antitoxin system prevent-host-death family antitoxin [Gammaproteobacteria bacterium]
MNNTVTVAEIKRRGMAAIEEGLRHGPVRIVKRNKPAAVVLSEEEYQRLIGGQPQARPGMTALQWLLSQPAGGTRDKAQIDATLAQERGW